MRSQNTISAPAKRDAPLTQEAFAEELLHHPLLARLNVVAKRHLGVGFMLVFPKTDGWGQAAPGGDSFSSDFCRVFQSTREGAQHCRMCHILMAVAACTQKATQQRCHAGASVLVNCLSTEQEHGLAVLTSCLFIGEDRQEAWKLVRRRGEKLGVDLKALEKAFAELPWLNEEKVILAQAILSMVREAVMEIRTRVKAEAALRKVNAPIQEPAIQATVEHELRRALANSRVSKAAVPRRRKKSSALLIEVVSDLVARKPNIPFTVAALAAAAHMTPNHFSNLFREQEGKCFSDFLAERRMALAQEMLKDLTLNISDVAVRAGYDDPGYFARRFKQHAGMSPRQWRCRLARPGRSGT